ncbi:protein MICRORCHIDIA 6 isoform X1 [Zingiber officinale]|uniref:protein MICRORCHIDIA 6 isoform X1 n=1 Tax=Zingiber officinale TaxID=94328 RepID=UPI001C4CBCF9|nr:protein MICRORCHIDIA 6 isoform X1 [Zingiber officinale]XP_042376028.1 protein MICRORCHIDIA 6 isoform X1 [Zingiber officinale]
MNYTNFIDLSCDEESEQTYFEDVKPIFPLQISSGKSGCSTVNDQSLHRGVSLKQELEESRSSTSGSSIIDQGGPSANMISLNFASPSSPVPLCRQFWKSGDYEVGQAISSTSENGRNRLRIHPKFLHSNATSHKWAFGAIAELLDNAVDEAQNGATLVTVEKFINSRDGSHALLIQDDGGGMDPKSLRRCISFGFSDKQSGLSIGQYGNGFKTSTMRLGADVIIFSRSKKERAFTQSIGLLSYTFLRETGCDDIIVPTADYEFDELTNSFKRLYRHDEKHFSSNLSTILEWSPFNTEDKLLAQFIDIGHHGTKIIIFNLWLNDDGNMELDFQLDAKDIMISEAQRQVQKHKHDSKQIANRLRFSLRAYISILYLRIPQNFRIVLRGEVVKPHNIANDLIYRECILYKPQACGVSEASIVTTIGFLDGAPNVNVHGFNVYHKNRLILPYWKVANNSYGKGRGVVGVLETNFIKPTHDKQDFEKSALYQKLESRLKEMTYEYWDLHCHLVGYYNNKKPAAPRPSTVVCQMPQLGTSSSLDLVETKDFTPAKLERTTLITASTQPISCITPTDLKCDGSIQTRLPLKRKNENQVAATRETKVQNLSNPFGSRSTKATKDSGSGVQPIPDIKAMILKNKELRDQCLEYEETEKQLVQKAKKLRAELLEVLEAYKKLLIDVIPIEDVKTETL